MTAPIKLPFWATFLTALGILILTSLGLWQLERLQWKEDLIEKIETAYANENPQAISLFDKHPNFQFGTITGRFLPEKAFLLGPPTLRDETPHLQLIVPLKTERHTVLINMGWTAAPLTEQPIYHLKGKEITFTGLLRYFSWNHFTPQNKPEEDLWYRLDIPLIAASKSIKNLHSAALIAESANYKFDAVFFGDERKEEVRKLPNNNHLQYACFWFTMAGALLIIYILKFLKKT